MSSRWLQFTIGPPATAAQEAAWRRAVARGDEPKLSDMRITNVNSGKYVDVNKWVVAVFAGCLISAVVRRIAFRKKK